MIKEFIINTYIFINDQNKMSIVIEDLDNTIISFLELPDMVNLMLVNVNYYDKIKKFSLIEEWNKIKYKYQDKAVINIFNLSCKKGYLSYAKSLLSRYNIDIHSSNEFAFSVACENGQLEIAKWLIELGEKHGYGKINIHDFVVNVFCYTCRFGQLQIAKWLIELGENHGYGKINIHHNYDMVFKICCLYSQIEIANWLIDLGENHGYNKIDSGVINMYHKLIFTQIG